MPGHPLGRRRVAGRYATGARDRATLSCRAVERYLDNQRAIQRRALGAMESRQSRRALRNALDSLFDRGRPAQRVFIRLPAVSAWPRRNAADSSGAGRAVLPAVDEPRRALLAAPVHLCRAALADA